MKIKNKSIYKTIIPALSLLSSIPAMAGWSCECEWKLQSGSVSEFIVEAVACSPSGGSYEGIRCAQETEYVPGNTIMRVRCANFAGPRVVEDTFIHDTSSWTPYGCTAKP